MGDDLTEFPTQRLRLQPCNICGRQFNIESLKKHQAICRKVSNKKRKIFDAGKQRAKDSDVPYKATRRTAQIYTGQIPAQDDRLKSKSKPNWREKHVQLIRAIREARSVTRAMKEGGPLPPFQPSEVPSDYVSCPYCNRNFNEHAAKRHMPFCQTQHERKHIQPQKHNQEFDRGRTLPVQHSSSYKQKSSSSGIRSDPHDVYNNGNKHSKSAPMLVRRNPSELQQQPPPPPAHLPPPSPRKKGGFWGSFRRLFGFDSDEEPMPDIHDYAMKDEGFHEPTPRHYGQQQVVIRTGRNQTNTSLNVRARQKTDEVGSNVRRGAHPPQPSSHSYNGQARNQYGNSHYNTTRTTAVRRPSASGNQCNQCGSKFTNTSARFCGDCGTKL